MAVTMVTVVGVVGDGKYIDIDEPETHCLIYFDLNQRYLARCLSHGADAGQPVTRLTPMSEALEKIDPQLSSQTLTMDDLMNLTLYVPRITLVCTSAFGGIGLYSCCGRAFTERSSTR